MFYVTQIKSGQASLGLMDKKVLQFRIPLTAFRVIDSWNPQMFLNLFKKWWPLLYYYNCIEPALLP